MKNGKIDLINILKYLMVLVLIMYVVFLISREGSSDVPVDTIEKNITKVMKTKGMSKGSAQDLKKYYGLNANDYDGVMLYIPNDVMSVNEVLVVKVKDESQTEDIEKAVQTRLDTQKKSFEGYGVEQTKLLRSAVVESKGSYTILVVSKDADKIDEAFRKSIR